jgi:hypothetical protein
MLVDLIARKMQDKGYLPVAFDGKYLVIEDEVIHIPPRIGRHRPDVIGIKPSTKRLCLGEAKTLDDLRTQRTREQFTDYSRVIGQTSGEIAELIIGTTSEAVDSLHQILAGLGMCDNPNVTYVILPEELVDNGQGNL